MEIDSRIDSKRIQDILELQRLKGLYFYHLDAQLLVDRDDENGPARDVTSGIDEVIKYVKERLATIPSVHHGHTPLYEFGSATEATGIWAMADIIYYSAENVLYGYGHYREHYRKETGIWKFSSVHLTRLKVDIIRR